METAPSPVFIASSSVKQTPTSAARGGNAFFQSPCSFLLRPWAREGSSFSQDYGGFRWRRGTDSSQSLSAKSSPYSFVSSCDTRLSAGGRATRRERLGIRPHS